MSAYAARARAARRTAICRATGVSAAFATLAVIWHFTAPFVVVPLAEVYTTHAARQPLVRGAIGHKYPWLTPLAAGPILVTAEERPYEPVIRVTAGGFMLGQGRMPSVLEALAGSSLPVGATGPGLSVGIPSSQAMRIISPHASTRPTTQNQMIQALLARTRGITVRPSALHIADMVVTVGPGLTLQSFSCGTLNFLSLHDADFDGHDELLLRLPGSRFVVARIRDRGLELVGGLRDPHFPDGRPGTSVEWEETAPPQPLMRRGVPYRYVTHGKSEFPGGDYLARLAWTRPGGVLRVEGMLYADLEVLTFPDARPIRVPPGARLPEFVETLARRGLFTLQKRND